ncbi:Sir2 family NAD-dependent protein deacetylase [Streptomyces cellostaticus]|uniref:Sir2 family NAD-dependent protein deacetylase n=1 Tax=Streptomyces cellostaticus TaxID=67285 RepID=UPI0027E24087|nr:Sir2 family NAD-dependent protein deacetylase [Streptomyces cellostaticus]
MTTHPTDQSPGDIPDWAHGVRRLVVFSGAGISTDSGIQDFRGPSGVWTLSPGLQTKHTYQAFMADPELRVSYWKTRYEHPVWGAEPNAGHRAVAALGESGIDTTVVTQNTDGLHQLAGTPADRVLELHGTMRTTLCVACGDRSPTTDVLARIEAGEATPPCPRCGGIQKTASTMFGQTMSPETFVRAEEAVTSCDLILAVGTTLTVEPAGSLCASAVNAGATLVIVNWDPTPYDAIATDIIRDPLGEALPRIAAQLRAAASGAATRAEAAAEETAAPAARPGVLLRADARTARFRSRTAELERLAQWCAGSGTRTHLVSGPAGSGKSRLALELADRVGESGDWDVVFPTRGAGLPDTGRPLLVVVESAETRGEQVARLRTEAAARESGAPVRLLLLARTDGPRPAADTYEELGAPDTAGQGHADAVLEAARDYAAALGAPAAAAVPTRDAPSLPGALQAAVLATALAPSAGTGGQDEGLLLRCELAYLRAAADEHGLELPAGVVAGAAATAVLCGAADEEAALAALGHLQALEEPELRLRVARWLREMYPPAAGDPGYWSESLPDALDEELVAEVATPRFLLAALMETSEDQDRRVLTVLARAAHTRPQVRRRLTELLSLLPGVSPAAVEVALAGGYPAPLAEALTALADKNPALPADLLDAVPSGVTVFGEFPVLLAESLVDAYERRARTQNGLRGLTRTLIELAERQADLGRAEQALDAARRAVETAGALEQQDGHLARAERALQRATELSR